MAKSELLRLAESGLAAFPPSGLGELATECRESAEAIASARLFVLAGVVELLAAAWEPFDAVSVDVRERLDALLSTRLPLILSEEDERAAVSLATSMCDDVSLVLTRGA